jgi:GTPase SAR1 family protein
VASRGFVQDPGGVRVLLLSYYKGAKGALIVFDVSNRNSFDDLSKFVSDAREHSDKNVVVGIVGNKIDLDQQGQRVVSSEEG